MIENLANLWRSFRVWLARRGPLVLLLVMLFLLLWLVPEWLSKPPSTPTRNLGPSTRHADVLWVRRDISFRIISNQSGVVYAVSLMGDSIMAIDIQTGVTVWKDELSFEHNDVRSLLANQSTVFAVTTLSVDAYDGKTGQFKWSTPLGEGHVSIMSQLDSNVLRVYYGGTIDEIDSGTGKLVNTIPKENTFWVSGNIVIKASPSYELSAYDKQTGEILWDHGPSFYLGERLEPQQLGTDTLYVAQAPGSSYLAGICALNLRTGKYDWCRLDGFNSMMAIDPESRLGYAMRGDLSLLTIDLQTGHLLRVTSFPSNEPNRETVEAVSSVMVSNEVVLVYFNDSAQTFALKFLP